MTQTTMPASESIAAIDRENRSALLQEAMRLTHGDVSEAEDLVQETLLKALRYARTGGRIRERNRRWLLTILTNTYIDRYRRKAVRPNETGFEDIEDLIGERPASSPQARSTAGAASLPWNEQRELYRWLFSDELLCALGKLPEVFRSAVVLTDVEGLSYQEAANRLKVPLGTVMSRIHRGRARLRQTLTSGLHPCFN